jgi:transposase
VAVLSELALGPMRAKRPVLAEALTGRFTAHHAFLVRAMLDRIDAAVAMEQRLSTQIDQAMRPFRHQHDLITTIPGVSTRAAEVILAEIGADPTRFPTAADLASWAGICPGNNQSGARAKPSPTRHGDAWLKAALGQVAIAASRTKGTYLAARYRRIAARRGKKRALVAVGHSVLTAVWVMLTRDVAYHDLGPDHFTERLNPHAKARQTRRLIHQLQQLGYQVTTQPAQAA